MIGVRIVVLAGFVVVGAACAGAGKAPKPAAPAAGQPAARTAPPRLIATVDLEQDRKVAVYAAAIHDGTPCWTFVTSGMAAKQHPELVLSIAMRKGDVAERYPASAVELLGSLTAALPESSRLDPWRSLTAHGGLLGRADLIGIAAVPAEGPPGIDLPDDAVTLLVLTAEETEIARDHGPARIAAMLGHHYRFYPTAWWLDRDRPTVVTRAQLATSGLAGVSGVRIPGLTTVLEAGAAPVVTKASDERGLPEAATGLAGATLHVRVSREAASEIARMLRGIDSGKSVLALLQPDPLAGGRFAWVPGQKAPQVITGPGFTGRVTGSFLAIGVDAGKDRAALAEDGAVLELTPAVRDAIAAALDGGRDYRGPAAADSIAWTVELVSQEPAGPGALTEITLLTPDDQISRRISTADLVAFLQSVEREVIGAVRGKQPTAAKARVHLTLRPRGRAIRIEAIPDDRGPWVADLQRRLERLPAVVVTGEVALHATFSLAAAAAAP